MKELTTSKYLASSLRGYANSLEKDWMTTEEVMGNLLVILECAGYLKKKELHYVKELAG